MIAVGVASPSEQGQAITSTATAGIMLCARSPEWMNQPIAVSAAMPSTAGTKMPETRSASFWIGALLACASATSLTICASVVSSPVRVTCDVEHAAGVERGAE